MIFVFRFFVSVKHIVSRMHNRSFLRFSVHAPLTRSGCIKSPEELVTGFGRVLMSFFKSSWTGNGSQIFSSVAVLLVVLLFSAFESQGLSGNTMGTVVGIVLRM